MKKTITVKKFKASIYVFKTRIEMIKNINRFLCQDMENDQAAQVCVFDSFDKKGKRRAEIMKAFFCIEEMNDIILIHEAIHMAFGFAMAIENKNRLVFGKLNINNEEKIAYCQGYIFRRLKKIIGEKNGNAKR